MSWYSAKTLYRLTAKGRPKNVDQYYDPLATLLEERIVLFQTESAQAAKKLAEQDAYDYAEEAEFENPYGQLVAMEYLKCCEISQLPGLPASGEEVFSSTEIVSKQIKNKAVIERKLGQDDPAAVGFQSIRRKFFDLRWCEGI